MKKFIIAVIAALYILLGANMVYAAANTWTQKTDFGGTTIDFGVGFSIGVKGYVGLGYDGSNLQTFWKYDPTANTWTQLANFTGAARASAVGFSIGSKGYVGLGADTSYNNYNDFYEYDPSANSWTAKTSFPGTARASAVGFSIGTKGYVGTGGRKTSLLGSTTYYQDFYEYNPSTNSWTAKTSFTGSARGGAVGFSIGNKGYVGTGNYGTTSSPTVLQDFYQYDPSANTWTSKASFPGTARTSAAGFAIGSYGYVGTGGYPSTTASSVKYYNDFYQYDPSTNTWTTLTAFPGTIRYGAVGFAIGSRGYIGTGYAGTSGNGSFGTKVKDFWEYEPDTMPSPLYGAFPNGIWKWDGNRWVQVTSYTPNLMIANTTNLYVTFGNGIWQWDGSAWTQLTPYTPKSMLATATTLYGAYTGFGIYKWDGSTWTRITLGTPQSMVTSGTNLYGAFPNGIWQWDGSAWTQLTPYYAPQIVISGTNLYTTFGNGIWKWDGTVWTSVTTYTPQFMVISGTNLDVNFGNGILQWDGSTWTQLTPNTPKSMAATETTLYATYTGFGIWQWDGTFWTQINTSTPSIIALGQ
jgi:N-acetylneuraminic acid mutarotase